LSDNAIAAVPPAIGSLAESLTVLRLPNNRLTSASLPGELWTCSTLKVLDLAGNAIAALPPAIAGLVGLVELNLARNRLSTLPAALCTLGGLALLRASDNPALAALPEELGRCSRLVEVAADNCAITHLPRTLAGCRQLRVLRCGNNRLTDDGVRDILAGCPALAWVDLRQNRLTLLPPLPPAPSEVFLGVNAISVISPSHVARASLNVLDLSDNRLAALPDDVLAGLTSLTTLDVRNNDLATLPPVLGYLASLKRIAIEGNPLRTLKRGLLSAPAEELKAYLRTRAAPEAAGAMESVAAAGLPAAVGPAEGEGGPHARAWAAATRDATVDGRLILPPAHFAAPPAPPLSRITLSLLHGGSLALLPRLRQLVVDGLPLAAPDALPRDLLTAAPALELLSMAACGLTDLPAAVLAPAVGDGTWPSLPALRVLRLPRNRLVVDDVQRLPPGLRVLDLSLNPLPHIPWGLPALRWLEELVLEGCGLASSTDPRYEAAALALPSLRSLMLAGNRLTSIPAVLTTLPALTSVDVRDNEIAMVDADALGRAHRNLVALHLEGNPQRTVRQPIVARGGGAVMEYLRHRVGGDGTIIADARPATKSAAHAGAELEYGPAPPASARAAPLPAKPSLAVGASTAVHETGVTSALGSHAATHAHSITEQIAVLEAEIAASGGAAGRASAETALLKRKLALLRAQALREART